VHPTPATEDDGQDPGHEVDPELHEAIATLAPDPVFQVVEHVHKEEVGTRTRAHPEEQQGGSPLAQQSDTRTEQTERKPGISGGKGILKAGVDGPSCGRNCRSVDKPCQPIGEDHRGPEEAHCDDGTSILRLSHCSIVVSTAIAMGNGGAIHECDRVLQNF